MRHVNKPRLKHRYTVPTLMFPSYKSCLKSDLNIVLLVANYFFVYKQTCGSSNRVSCLWGQVLPLLKAGSSSSPTYSASGQGATVWRTEGHLELIKRHAKIIKPPAAQLPWKRGAQPNCRFTAQASKPSTSTVTPQPPTTYRHTPAAPPWWERGWSLPVCLHSWLWEKKMK